MFPYKTAFFTLIGIIVGALLAAGVFFGVKVYQSIDRGSYVGSPEDGKGYFPQPLDIVPITVADLPQGLIVAGDDAYGNFKTYENEGKVRMYDSRDYPTSSVQVDWNWGAQMLSSNEIESMQLSNISLLYKENPGSLLCGYENGVESVGKYFEESDCLLQIYKAGTLTAPESLRGKTLYLAFRGEPGMGISYVHNFLIYDDTLRKFVALGGFSDWQLKELGLVDWVHGVIPYSLDFHELVPPKSIKIPNDMSVLRFEKSLGPYTLGFDGVSAGQNRGGLLNIFSGETYIPFHPKEVVFTHETLGDVYFRDDSYNIVLPDGSVQMYDLVPYFLSPVQPPVTKGYYRSGYNANITWNDGVSRKIELYDLSGEINTGGCGGGIVPCTNIVNDMPWFSIHNLVEIGKTSTDEPIYELGDKAINDYYRQLFDFGYEGAKILTYDEAGVKWEDAHERLKTMTDQEKYDEFVEDAPLFFWKDNRGKWRMYKKAKYTTLAECGKPVIYLYPEKEQDVRVSVAPTGGFTETIPAYPDDGWFVRATPESKLYNYADEKSYPYLFWEGIGYDYVQPKQGFVFAKEDVAKGVRELLAKQGLVENEIEDFMEFWEPRLTVKDHVFVTFVSQERFDKMAPLIVEPKPDTVIRVFMDYTPLDKPMDVDPIYFQTPERNGFAVVEWGGALHR